MSRDVVPSGHGQPHVTSHCPLDNQLIENMKKNMTDELEQRRQAWERDVVKLQEDFFKVKLGDDAKFLPPLTVDAAGGQTDPSNHLVPPENGGPDDDQLFRLRFNVKDYRPDDINVRAEGNKLTVAARRIEGEASNSKVTKQFSKQVDIPSYVIIERLISYLTPDGILTVEAPTDGSQHSLPICPAAARRQAANHERPAIEGPTNHSPELTAQQAAVAKQFSNPFSDVPRQPYQTLPSEGLLNPKGTTDVCDTEYGRMLKLNVDLGRSDYRPEEVKVKVYRRKLSVSALHEETRQGKRSRREFHREFDLPEPIEISTLKAFLDVSRGVLFVGASFVSNEKHNMVSYLINKQLPMFGKQVQVEQHY